VGPVASAQNYKRYNKAVSWIKRESSNGERCLRGG